MAKSLTETAKAILMKEGAIPSVSPMDAGHPDREAKAMNPNMATLRPGSRSVDPDPKHNEAEDMGGQTPESGAPTDNLGARAAAKLSKDKSKAGMAAVAAEPAKKASMAEELELDEEEQLNEVGDTPKGQKKLHKTFMRAAERLKNTPKYVGAKLSDDDIKNNKKNSETMRMANDRLKSDLDEEIEISEELEDFINAMLEEGYSEEQIAEAIEENFEIVTEESHDKDEDKKDKDDKDDDKEDKKKEKKVDMKEHVDALLAGEQLSEEFRAKAETIFESAVTARVQEELSVIEEAYAESLEEEVAKIHAELTEQVDDYLNYVVEQWVAENEVAIESGLRSELTEDFISGLRNLFAEHYIDIPEDKVSIIEELGTKVEALESKLNEEIDRNVSLTKMINESKQFEILVSACDGLTNTQAERLKALAENVSFTSSEEFAAKVETLKESYFPTHVKADAVLDNAEPSDDPGRLMTEELSGPMAAYVRTLGKSLQK